MRRERRRTLLSSHSSCQVSGEGEQTRTLMALWIHAHDQGKDAHSFVFLLEFFLSSLTLFSLFEQR